MMYFIHQIHTNMFRPKLRSPFFCLFIFWKFTPSPPPPPTEKSVVAYQWALCDVPEASNLFHAKCSGIYGLFVDFVGGLLYRVSNGRIINRQWTGTDAAGSGSGLIWRSNSAFSWNRVRTPTRSTPCLSAWNSEQCPGNGVAVCLLEFGGLNLCTLTTLISGVLICSVLKPKLCKAYRPAGWIV